MGGVLHALALTTAAPLILPRLRREGPKARPAHSSPGAEVDFHAPIHTLRLKRRAGTRPAATKFARDPR